ncbi:MAG: galactitol-1-phosphate 5-dehydrogenase [Pseudobutyrivibrio sp.]|nr:galactitol-1-phosphate 5-dehydrogenase [Pseudobutyrivibrio sp.]
MKALVLNDVGKLKIENVSTPEVAEKQVLIKVGACGICGSDIPRAYKDGAHDMPLIIGHEFAGTVVDLWEDVSSTWKDKRVGVFPLIPCMECDCCAQKKYEMCKNYSYLGSRVDGGFAEYVLVPEWNLIELPENVTMQQAAMLEPMAVAVHAIRQAMPQLKGLFCKCIDTLPHELMEKNIVVMGLGTIGLLITMFLKDVGFKNVFVVGNKDLQKKMSAELDIEESRFCDAREKTPEEWIMKKTENRGTDVFFECIGSQESLLTGINAAAPAGTVCTVGNPHTDMDLPRNTYWKILRNQLTLTGTWNSSFTHDKFDDWHYVISRLKQEKIHPEKLITHSFDMDNIIEGFEIMRDKKEEYVKVMWNATR